MNPKITFGMIVLNGEPFVRYNLRSLYPFAHQIIVVEGACPAARNIATPDGHSRDTTIETLRRFEAEEDPDDKLIIVTAEDDGHPNGFWPGEKDEMSQAYAKRTTGNYLWQVDSDEFYKHEDIITIIGLMNAGIGAISVPQITFWGSLDYLANGFFLIRGFTEVWRVFQWAPGYRYAGHRPPTVVDENGSDLRNGRHMLARDTRKLGICMLHYSLLFPKQVQEKSDYYAHIEWSDYKRMQKWADQSFRTIRRPFRVHNVYEHPSWLEKYSGGHPTAIYEMMNDISERRIVVDIRDMKDVEILLNTQWYSVSAWVLKKTVFLYSLWSQWSHRISLVIHNPKRVMCAIAQRYDSIVHKLSNRASK